ncbi:DUF5317 domain-containing protein [Desulfosporosinus sp. PR]|uniref:DUF5317 domain-containing protein n=1 Tax=Candidatus Desulfosporosinus nitrosoreducens TaxID=3401928 RepID=UPI0027FDF362|nr:DUF5317 domain-containing protein [Desulfosporosinus sp. PR]MDQ7095601.1 DUF5317 domain-containing protein [Desulfosporosinus sp. PR]
MLVETLILALIVGVVSGGKLGRLGELELRGFWLVPLALLIQGAVYWTAVKNITIGPNWFGPILDTGSYFLLLIFTLCNSKLSGMRWITLGVLLNTLVISLNGGIMPVDPFFLPESARESLSSGQGTHGLLSATTHLAVLADRFYLAIPGLQKQVFSLGDCSIDLGCFILVFRTMKKIRTVDEPEIKA